MAEEQAVDRLDRARLIFRGEDMDALVSDVAKAICRAYRPWSRTIHAGPESALPMDERDVEAAERAIAVLAELADKRAKDVFDRHMEERARIESESHAFWEQRYNEATTRLALLSERLPDRGRKTMPADAVREVLNAKPEELDDMVRAAQLKRQETAA